MSEELGVCANIRFVSNIDIKTKVERADRENTFHYESREAKKVITYVRVPARADNGGDGVFCLNVEQMHALYLAIADFTSIKRYTMNENISRTNKTFEEKWYKLKNKVSFVDGEFPDNFFRNDDLATIEDIYFFQRPISGGSTRHISIKKKPSGRIFVKMDRSEPNEPIEFKLDNRRDLQNLMLTMADVLEHVPLDTGDFVINRQQHRKDVDGVNVESRLARRAIQYEIGSDGSDIEDNETECEISDESGVEDLSSSNNKQRGSSPPPKKRASSPANTKRGSSPPPKKRASSPANTKKGSSPPPKKRASSPAKKRPPRITYDFGETTWMRKSLLCSDPKDVKDRLARLGVAIVPKFFTDDECDTAFESVMLDLEKIIPSFRYRDSRTWSNIRRDGKAIHGMLIQHWGVAWMQSVVNIRQDPKFARWFSDLWKIMNPKGFVDGRGCEPEDMLMSSDGIAVHLNRSDCSHGWHRPGYDWFHTDAAASDRTLSIQSFLNFNDSIVGDAFNSRLDVIIRSHQHLKDFNEKFPNRLNKRFNRIENQEQADYLIEQGCEMVSVQAKKGDLVLWLSSLFHQGRGADKPSSRGGNMVEYKRLAVYVSMQPKSYAAAKDLIKKKKAYNDSRCTYHNAAKDVGLFSSKPRSYGKPYAANCVGRRPALNDQGRRQWAL